MLSTPHTNTQEGCFGNTRTDYFVKTQAGRLGILAIIVALFAALMCIPAGSALAKNYTDSPTRTPSYYAGTLTNTYVLDHYGLLSSSESAQLEARATEISDSCELGVYLVIVDNIGNDSVRQYAKNYYMGNNLGYKDGTSGIMFLIAVESRDYVTITYNKGVEVFTDYRIEALEDDVVSELKNNNWVDACEAYYASAGKTIEFYNENDEPLDHNNDPSALLEDLLIMILIGVVAGCIIAGITCGIWYSQMKTAKLKTEANDFFDDSSFRLTGKRDRFLHTARSVVLIETEKNDHGGFGGGGSFVDAGGFGGSSGGKF